MSNMALRRIIPMICLWLMILICFHGCDGTDTTEPVLIDLPPDAEEAIISLGSSPAQTVEVGEKDVDLRITPGADELGKTNILLVQFKDSSGKILEGSEVTEKVDIGKSGRTDINLWFALITDPFVRATLAEGEIGIKIDAKGWNFKPNEDIEIYLIARGSDVQSDIRSDPAVESAWATIRSQTKIEYQNKAPGAISISADEPVSTARTDVDGHFETTFEVPSDLIYGVLAGKTFIRAVEMESGFTVEVPFAITGPYIYVYPLTGSVGTEIAVTGLNFGANEYIRIDFGDTKEVAQTRAEADGSFSATFRIPEDAPVKRTSVQANGLGPGYTKAVTFGVSVRDVDVDPPVGVVGTELAVKGENFGAEEEIRIDFGDIKIQDFYDENGDEVSPLKTNEEGSFEAKFPVPKSEPGTISIQATEMASGHKAEAQFTLFESRIYVDPPAGASGDEVIMIGSAFGASEEIRIDFGEAGEVAQVTTDADGSFEKTFAVPKAEPGTSIIRAVGQNSDNEAEFPFTIPAPSISLDHIEGVMGNEITVNGWGFGKNEEIKIKLFRVELIGEVAETRAGDSGEFEAVFTVPKGIDPGSITVEAAGLMSDYKTRARFLILPCAITVNPTSGVVDTRVTVIGAGFGSQEDIQIDFGHIQIMDFYDKNGNEVSPLKSDVWGGQFIALFDVPAGVKPGQITVTATGLASGKGAEFPFTIPESGIEVDPSQGIRGSEVTMRGWGFGVEEDIQIDFGDVEAVATIASKADGSFETSFNAGFSRGGEERPIYVTGMKSGFTEEASFFFKVPSATFSPGESLIGTEIILKGYNFGVNEGIEIHFGSELIDEEEEELRVFSRGELAPDGRGIITDGDGRFETGFEVPAVDPGRHSVWLWVVHEPYTIGSFTIPEPSIEVDPSIGIRGSEVTVNGWNFGAEEVIQIDFGDVEAVASIASKADGSFEASFNAGFSRGGEERPIYVTGMESGLKMVASFIFRIPIPNFRPRSGGIDDEITIWGSDFGAEEVIQIYFGNVLIEELQISKGELAPDDKGIITDKDGEFRATFKVPEFDSGQYRVKLHIRWGDEEYDLTTGEFTLEQ